MLHKLIKLNSPTEYIKFKYQNDETGMMVPFAGEEKEFEYKLKELDRTKCELEREKYAVISKGSQYMIDTLCMICVPPEETEFFTDEFNDLILMCINKELAVADVREKTMLEDVLACNKMSASGRKKMGQVSEVIKRSAPWTAQVQKDLEREGFVFESSSKHHRAYYKEKRYNVIFSNTASDFRTGENTASDIMKKISIYAIE